jgi:hypothetical protein
MIPLPHILADGGDVGKVVFGVIAILIWIASGISSSMNKQNKERERRARELEELARQGVLTRPTAPPPPLPPLPGRASAPQQPRALQRAVAMPTPPVPVQQQRQQRRQGKKQQKGRVPLPPPPARVAPPHMVQLEEIVTPSPQRAPAARTAASAHPIATLLRKSLRQQIVLNEILQPPVALREPREI